MTPELLQASDLTMTFGGISAVRGVSIRIEAGDLRCIIGPNGAGKSTVFNMLAGSIRPTGGNILFEGRSIVGRAVHEFARLGIARKFQVPSLFGSLTVRENLDVAMQRGPQGRERGERIDRTLELLELTDRQAMRAGDLAHGQKQWLEIGMALMTQPRLLLLDEPTAGMGPEETQRTARLLLGIKGQTTIIAIEHDMHFVRALACPTLVMHQGRIVAEGSFEEIERSELVRDVYLGRQ